MKIREQIGNFLLFAAAKMGANPDYIPRVRSFFDAIERRVMDYYDAASQSRIRSDWASSTNTPYSHINPDLKRIIARSRESSDNNGLSENIDNVFMSNVVHTGIKPEPAVVDVSGNPVEAANAILAAGWERVNDQWDRSGHSTYYECQGMMLRTLINSGSVLVNLVKSSAGSYLPIAGQIIEPDRLDFSKDYAPKGMSDNRPEKQTQYGIDLDEYGSPIRYWLQGIERSISADNMSIRFKRRRPEQYIGVPWKAPVLTALWDLGSLMEDQFVSSRIRAMIAFWIHKNDAPGLAKGLNSNRNLSMEPGRTLYTSTKPEIIGGEDPISDTFDPLTRLCQRSIAIGTGLSYQILTKDLQGMNFAASRANILEDRRIFQMIQKWFIKEVCQPDYSTFVKWMFLSGKMAPLTFADYMADPWKWTQCFWQPPGWDWVDPTKDANASIELYKNNMTTLKEHYGSKGKNWRAELAQIAKEKEEMKSLGLQMPDELMAEAKKQDVENAVTNAMMDLGQ